MEYCEKGDMASLPRPMSEENCRHYFRGIFSGLRYLKKRQIIHRDIKPQNILLTSDNEVKIADFTFSKQIEEDELLQTQCGTPLFISPDVMFGKPYTDKSDLYSCGVMLYSFLYGTHPLGNVKSQADLIQKMKRAKITFPQKLVYETYEKTTEDDDDFVLCRTIRVFSPDVLRLCKGLLKFNPAERISWDIVYDDPWLRLDPIDSDELFPSETIQASDEILEVGGTIHAFSAPSQFSDRRLVPVPRSSQPFRRSTVEDISPPLTTPPNTTCKQHSFEQRATNNSSVENTENTSGKSSEMSGGGATRIIQDYYSSSPDMFTGGVGMFSLSPSGATKVITDIEQHINKKTANQSPPTLSKAAEAKPKDTNIHTFLSRSIDTIQKVFSL
jgi:serine/threonine protein kinase